MDRALLKPKVLHMLSTAQRLSSAAARAPQRLCQNSYDLAREAVGCNDLFGGSFFGENSSNQGFASSGLYLPLSIDCDRLSNWDMYICSSLSVNCTLDE